MRLSDKIAYINHDIDDAERAGILREEDIPIEYREILGFTIRERLNTLIHDIVRNSEEKADIIMSSHIEEAMQGLRSFMFRQVYRNPKAKGEEARARNMLQELYRYYSRHLEMLPGEYQELIEKRNEREERVVCDYIAGMTDQYSINKFSELFIPKSWQV